MLAVLFWSTSASAFKVCLSPERLNVPILSLLLGASLASCAVLFLQLLLSGKVNSLAKLTKENFVHSAFLGLLNPFLYYIVLFKSYSLLPAQQAQPLNFVWPLTLVLLSVLILKQKIKRRDIMAILISFLGVLIISTGGHLSDFKLTSPLGVTLAVGSSIPWALYWIYNIKDKLDEVLRLFLNFCFASVYVLILILLTGRLETPGLKGIIGVTYVGLFEMGITFLLWLKALKLSKTTAHIANLIFLVPFMSLVVVHFVIGETILLSTIIGLVFIIGGIIFQRL